jgi:hypothetical protein
VSARPSTSQKLMIPCLPRPTHASGLAPCRAHDRKLAHESDWSPHSRIVREKLTAEAELISSDIFFTQEPKSSGMSDDGMGRRSHDVRRAHIRSTALMSGGTTWLR